MSLRCVFHVSPTAPTQPKPERRPSVVDIETSHVASTRPRGRSVETWARARGWASEED